LGVEDLRAPDAQDLGDVPDQRFVDRAGSHERRGRERPSLRGAAHRDQAGAAFLDHGIPADVDLPVREPGVARGRGLDVRRKAARSWA
jgi:hypothetical protein